MNNAQIAEIRARAERALDDDSYETGADMVRELEGLGRDVLALIEVAEAAQEFYAWESRQDWIPDAELGAYANACSRLEQALQKLVSGCVRSER